MIIDGNGEFLVGPSPEQEAAMQLMIQVRDLKEVIRGRDEGIAFLEKRVKKLELQLAQALARENIDKAPRGFVSARKRRKHEERVAKAAVKEARHV